MKKACILMACTLMMLSCTKKKEEEPKSSANFAAQVSANISKVASGFTPGSLAASRRDTCDGTTGLLGCQPNLLKIYLASAKEQLEAVRAAVTSLATSLGELKDGAEGTVETDEGFTVTYAKNSATSWSIQLGTNGTNIYYISVEDGTYTLEADLTAAQSGSTGQFQTIIDFTDENTWSMVVTMTGATCEASNPQGPQNIRIRMEKADGLWIGKTMIYSPRFADFSATCATTATDAIGLNLYSDIVADENVAKMNVYTLKRTRTANQITTVPIGSFCTEYASLCTGGVLGAETPADYVNPVCVESGSSDGTWNSNCSGNANGATVAAASFGPASDWIAPSLFYNFTIDIGPAPAL